MLELACTVSQKKGFSNFHEFGVPLLITRLLLDCKLFKIINELY